MITNKIPAPKTLWYENEVGEEIEVGFGVVMEDGWYQHSKILEIRDSVCVMAHKAKWPVRFLKWLISKTPYSWRDRQSGLYSGSTTINCALPVINKLVKDHDMCFADAAVVASELCNRCESAILSKASDKTWKQIEGCYCDYCQYIDPKYHARYRCECCYLTMKYDGNIARAFQKCCTNRGKDYLCHPIPRPWYKRFWDWFYY